MTARDSRHALLSVAIAVGLWGSMLVCLEIGRRLGIAHLQAWGADAWSGVGAVDGAVFGLLALLVGFTFNGAANRFDRRRELVSEEANSISTAWQRIALLADDQQSELRRLFRGYLDALVLWCAAPSRTQDSFSLPASITRAQDAMWASAVSACLTSRGEPARVLLLPSLNDMFGAVDRERMMRHIHPPTLVFAMLGLTELAAAVFAGYALANTPTRNWTYIVGIATAISLATYVIIELEFPRLGWVRIDDMDRELETIRDSIRSLAA
jgi:hypothetical protein